MVKDGWRLIYRASGAPVAVGDKVTYSKGLVLYVCGGTPPQSKDDRGAILASREPGGIEGDYYPKVCGLVWQKVEQAEGK